MNLRVLHPPFAALVIVCGDRNCLAVWRAHVVLEATEANASGRVEVAVLVRARLVRAVEVGRYLRVRRLRQLRPNTCRVGTLLADAEDALTGLNAEIAALPPRRTPRVLHLPVAGAVADRKDGMIETFIAARVFDDATPVRLEAGRIDSNGDGPLRHRRLEGRLATDRDRTTVARNRLTLLARLA